MIGEEEQVEKPAGRGARNQQVGRAGEHFVVAEMNKRGAYAVCFAGNMPTIDVMACDQGRSRNIHIQVKTKRGGRTWHASTLWGRPTTEPRDETVFWIFVDLGAEDATPRYWVVPDWWIRNDIHTAHQDYLIRHGGKRARNQESTHHSIDEQRLKKWLGRWDILGVF